MLADKEAKKAAEGSTSDAALLPKALRKPLKFNKSAAKQRFNEELKSLWNKEWVESPRADRIKHIDATMPSKNFLKTTSDPKLSRKGASWIYQLRSGHFPLNVYLHKFKRTESARCPACGHHTETPQHFILDCPAYTFKRWLLMAGKSPPNREYTKLIGDAKNAIPIANYIQATGRFAPEFSRRDGTGGGREVERRDLRER